MSEWRCGPECPFFGEQFAVAANDFHGPMMFAECRFHEDTEWGDWLRNEVGGKCIDELDVWVSLSDKLTAAIAARKAKEAEPNA